MYTTVICTVHTIGPTLHQSDKGQQRTTMGSFAWPDASLVPSLPHSPPPPPVTRGLPFASCQGAFVRLPINHFVPNPVFTYLPMYVFIPDLASSEQSALRFCDG